MRKILFFLNRFTVEFLVPEPLKMDSTNPDWHDRICYSCGTNNLLQNGVNQALWLTNTVKVADELPKSVIEKIEDTEPEVDRLVERYEVILFLFFLLLNFQ